MGKRHYTESEFDPYLVDYDALLDTAENGFTFLSDDEGDYFDEPGQRAYSRLKRRRKRRRRDEPLFDWDLAHDANLDGSSYDG